MQELLVHDDEGLTRILTEARTIAVVGLSSSRLRPSHGVAAYLQRAGYRIIPVNPNESEVLGEPAVPSLAALAGRGVDVVEVFRRPSEVRPLVAQAAGIGARVLWLQDGVIDAAAAAEAHALGLTVVMDRCMLRDHRRLMRR